jgi:hypothetical protein
MRLSAHPPCLHETLHTAEAAGIELKEVPLVGVVGISFDVGTELGPYISRSMPELLELVVKFRTAAPCKGRSARHRVGSTAVVGISGSGRIIRMGISRTCTVQGVEP